jgi:transcriptional regulator with XRE-family HTH domain
MRNLSEVYKKGLPLMSELYKRIEELCNENHVNITTMCKDSGASRASLTDLKKGRKQSLSTETLNKIAKYFSVSVDYLIGNVSEPFFQLDNKAILEEINSYEESKKAPTEDGERSENSDILDEVDVAFYGDYKQLTEENKETLRAMARLFRERQGKQE